MNRGEPLRRTKPLTVRKGLTAHKGLTTHTKLSPGDGQARRPPPPGGDHPAPRRSTPQQRARAAQRDAWEDLRTATFERDGYRCAWCGRYDLRLEVHHRAMKGHGGSKLLDHLANLVTLHGHGNASGCHGLAHTDRVLAVDAGMTVPRGTDPRGIPVRYIDGLWLLDDDGNRSPIAA